MDVTQKQENYCQQYMLTGNKVEAYKHAYKTDNMKPSTISVRASELARKPNVAARIEQLRVEVKAANAPALDMVIKEITDIAMFDIAEIYNDDGTFKPVKEIPRHIRSAITSIKTYEKYDTKSKDRKPTGVITEIRTLNKLDAFEKLMKHLGGYQVDNNQKSNKVVIIQVPDNGRK